MKFLLQKREATSNRKQEPPWTGISSEHTVCSCFGEGGNLHSDSARVYIHVVQVSNVQGIVRPLHFTCLILSAMHLGAGWKTRKCSKD